MATRFQSVTRGAIRRSVGINLGICLVGSATSTIDSSSLIDTKHLLGADDHYNGQEVLIYSATGSIVAGESSIVSDFAGSTNDATCAPVFTASITSGDAYEMWKRPWLIGDINDIINQAINEATGKVYPIKETHTAWTEKDKYLYNELSGFTHINRVDFVYSIGTKKTIHECSTSWDDDTDVDSSADTSFYKQGGSSTKMVVAAGAAANDILATDVITSVDLSGCTEAVIWVYSTVALAAGDLQLLMDDTALCASPVESLDIPATTANTWTRHIITLANPQSDSAVISVGIKMVTDKGAFSLWVDDIYAQDNLTNDYRPLPDDYWEIIKGSTPYLRLTAQGLAVAGDNTQLKLSGYQLCSQLSADATAADIDPAFIVAKTCERMLMRYKALISESWLGDAAYYKGEADGKLRGMATSFEGSTRTVN